MGWRNFAHRLLVDEAVVSNGDSADTGLPGGTRARALPIRHRAAITLDGTFKHRCARRDNHLRKSVSDDDMLFPCCGQGPCSRKNPTTWLPIKNGVRFAARIHTPFAVLITAKAANVSVVLRALTPQSLLPDARAHGQTIPNPRIPSSPTETVRGSGNAPETRLPASASLPYLTQSCAPYSTPH